MRSDIFIQMANKMYETRHGSIMRSDNFIRMANTMYEARKSVKTIYGKAWKSRIEKHKDGIRVKMKEDSSDAITAALRLCAQIADHAPASTMFLLAAAVEIVEPE